MLRNEDENGTLQSRLCQNDHDNDQFPESCKMLQI